MQTMSLRKDERVKTNSNNALGKFSGEPYAGNLHVRFEEGEGCKNPSLLYRLCDQL